MLLRFLSHGRGGGIIATEGNMSLSEFEKRELVRELRKRGKSEITPDEAVKSLQSALTTIREEMAKLGHTWPDDEVEMRRVIRAVRGT